MIRHASDPAPWVKKSGAQTRAGAGNDPGPVTTTAPRSPSLDGVAVAALWATVKVAPTAQGGTDIPIRDWEVLFCAVKDRLSLAVGAGQDSDSTHDRRSGSGVMRGLVIECVQALDQLHGALLSELDRCEELERNLFEAQIALAQLRAELLDTQAGARAQRERTGHAFFDPTSGA